MFGYCAPSPLQWHCLQLGSLLVEYCLYPPVSLSPVNIRTVLTKPMKYKSCLVSGYLVGTVEYKPVDQQTITVQLSGHINFTAYLHQNLHYKFQGKLSNICSQFFNITLKPLHLLKSLDHFIFIVLVNCGGKH